MLAITVANSWKTLSGGLERFVSRTARGGWIDDLHALSRHVPSATALCSWDWWLFFLLR